MIYSREYPQCKNSIIYSQKYDLAKAVKKKSICKKEAAEQFCKERGLIYKLTYCSKLSVEQMVELYINNDIKFLDRYEEKFLLYIKNKLSL